MVICTPTVACAGTVNPTSMLMDCFSFVGLVVHSYSTTSWSFIAEAVPCAAGEATQDRITAAKTANWTRTAAPLRRTVHKGDGVNVPSVDTEARPSRPGEPRVGEQVQGVRQHTSM
ncbi:hypothetical protein GCM10009733_036950 [Nonomuraea maheshkhaliensis]|uniref:Uncharacterized protein n=1 Tax=Nonomuraea maheshkhaliensis TaxID=419590 RepID=A0ABN2FA25_9ACTN